MNKNNHIGVLIPTKERFLKILYSSGNKHTHDEFLNILLDLYESMKDTKKLRQIEGGKNENKSKKLLQKN